MKKCIGIWLAFVFASNLAVAQVAPAKTPAKKAASASEQSQKPKFKAIWEPLNYKQDLVFNDVYFANDQVGWIAGGKDFKTGGFILGTKDGGDHWTVQLGDPQSSDSQMRLLRFMDDTHGWAVQFDKLLATSDGTNWEDVGTINASVRDYVFTSPTHGIAMTPYSDEKIYTTNDGGKTWKTVFQCATTVEVNGLTQNVSCNLEALHFPTAKVGYAVGGAMNDGPGNGFFVVVKTEDGGETWKVVSTVVNVPHASAVFFTDANTGFTRNQDSKFYGTTDGGLTWHTVTGSSGNQDLRIAFVDPQLGWTGGRRALCVTTDGGRHWNSREFNFPTTLRAFSLPRRDRAYVVGEHGMIYRYRVVPIEYSSKGMLDAPLMPSAGAQ
jgi:photosystem II stability/assembly factor-like uncharacterized protein